MSKIAILFWCYKYPEICADRVSLLRHKNPGTPIYVLYGGSAQGAADMEKAIACFIDDFWMFDQQRSARWKWENGDRLIARWFACRGYSLDWDNIFVAQWDMLITTSIESLIGERPDHAAVFTGLLPLDEVRSWWKWSRGYRKKLRLAIFRARLILIERYFGPIFTAPFIIVFVSRCYVRRLSKIVMPLLGFIEYRCPTFAAAWGYNLWTTDQLEAYRQANPNTTSIPENRKIISASKVPVSNQIIRDETMKDNGSRVFHPVYNTSDEIGISNLLYDA
jgi:hypothetical protein